VGGPASACGLNVTTSWGRRDVVEFSRDAKLAPSLEVAASTNDAAPFPLTSGFTSHSAKVPVAIAPLSSCGPEVRAGRLAQVMPVSLHELVVPCTAGPSTVALSVSNSRSFALVTCPSMPDSAKRR
jgi:hypothetical protein